MELILLTDCQLIEKNPYLKGHPMPITYCNTSGKYRIGNYLRYCLFFLTVMLSGQEGMAQRPGLPAPDEQAVETYIPSAGAPSPGVAIRIVIPKQTRYANGSPVVVQVPGGLGSSGLTIRSGDMHRFGFVEIKMAFTGGGGPNFRSGGTFDYRGKNSIRALADVVNFANGKVRDTKGRTLQDICGSIQILPNNIGMAGWSNGGNGAVVVMAEHGEEFPDVAFLATHESPFGDGAVSAELGGFGVEMNPAYDADTGTMNLSLLAYDPDATTIRPRPQRNRPGAPAAPKPPVLHGAFYYDMNRNGRLDAEVDFKLSPVLVDLDDAEPVVPFSIMVLEEAERRRLVKGEWPTHFIPLKEARAFWHLRDGAGRIQEAIAKCPKLAVICYGSERDHVQRAIDHPHVLAGLQGFNKAGASFLRFNPDRAYVEWVMGKPLVNVTDNSAGVIYDHLSIRAALEPEDAANDREYMAAALCELADRVHSGNFQNNLDSILFPETPKD
jgi:hypothetical protein